MSPRTPHLVADALLVGAVIVLWRAVHDAAEGLQHMARTYADHRCSDVVTVTAELRPPSMRQQRVDWHYVAGERLVQPAPMTDPALARSPYTHPGS